MDFDSGVFFGREQPALLVYQNGSEEPVDIFPHVTKGRRVSIEEFLEERNGSCRLMRLMRTSTLPSTYIQGVVHGFFRY